MVDAKSKSTEVSDHDLCVVGPKRQQRRGVDTPPTRRPLAAALIGDRVFRARIQGAFQRRAFVTFCRTSVELVHIVRQRLVWCVVAEPWDADGVSIVPVVRLIKSEFPSITVLAYVDVSERACREALHLAHAGADEILVRGVDDTQRTMWRTLATARARNAAVTTLSGIATLVSEESATLIALCIERATSIRTVHDAARILGISRKTLFNRVAADSLPCPAVIIAWCRLIAAAQILEDPGRTVERVGMSLGFGCGGGLRNMFRRYTGLSPSEIRDRGGPGFMADRFRDLLLRTKPAPIAR